MSNIPTGNVTFLFTDIEGSTKLAQVNNDSYIDALSKHHEILYEVIDSNNGFVFKIIGDAFCCAFGNAAEAVKASVDVQIKLNTIDWKDSIVKVRMGIHTGIAEWSGKDYMGYITLARTQRVVSAAYGGQVLISTDAYDNLKEKIPEEISFRDLGERRLKDLIQPMKLYQIVSSQLTTDFPPLKTLDARPNNLPVQLTSFIGRENQIKHLKDLLKNSRLITLLGTGGAGKTRLAMQAGADLIDVFANGVFIAELAPVTNPALIVQNILNSLGLKEVPGKSVEETLTNHLKDKEILLILDNCEHLIDESAHIVKMLLSSCDKLKLIATSREVLNCPGEQTYAVPSMSLPDTSEDHTPEKITQYESVRLFIERALSVNPNFRVNNTNASALAEICNRLDGIPLAIELAAARTRVLTVEKIYERLDDCFRLLTGGSRTALPRQQTLRALIDWSYNLLSEKEKLLWGRLSVFKGGWTLEAAEEICSDEKVLKEEILDLLSNLTEKSTITFDDTNERYKILETIKQYGEEKLIEAKEAEEILSKHLHYYMEFSEKAEPKLNGSEMQVWLEKLEEDHGNFQSAIEWSIRARDIEKGARLAGALGSFWDIRGHYSTGRRLLDSILDNAQGVSKSALAKVLYYSGMLTMFLGEYARAQKFFEESLTLRREMEDKSGIADSLNNLGNVAYFQGNYEQTQKFHEESLTFYRDIGNKHGIAVSLSNLGIVAYIQGNYEQAQKHYEESLSLNRELGNKLGIAASLINLGNIVLILENYEQAQKLLEESQTLNREMGNKHGIANSLISLGNLESNRENYEQTQKFYEESLTLSREIGDKHSIANSLKKLGNVTYLRGNYEQSQKFYEESLSLKREIGAKRGIAGTLNSLGIIAKDQGNYEQAQKYYEESLIMGLETGYKDEISNSLLGFAEILCYANKLSMAVMLLGAVEATPKSMGKVLDRDGQKLQEQIVNKLHEKLSDEEFLKYLEEGKKLTLEQVAELALSNEQ